MAEMVPSAAAEFNAVIAEALDARRPLLHDSGRRARCVLGDSLREVAGRHSPNASNAANWNAERYGAAQDALADWLRKRAARPFLGGASNKFIADRIEARSSCRLPLSFPPGDLLATRR